MNKIVVVLSLLLMSILLVGCSNEDKSIEEITIPNCDYKFEYYYGEVIPINDVSIENAKIIGDTKNFINICKGTNLNPILLSDSTLKAFKIDFLFDNIYPLKDLEITNYLADKNIALQTINIDVSVDGRSFTRLKENVFLSNEGNMVTTIDLGNEPAKIVRFVFKAEKGIGNYGGNSFGLNDIRFYLGDGLIIKKDNDWENAFLRYEGWSGADGIFSFNLTNGHDYIGAEENKTGFIFSDTFVGSVYTHNGLRKSSKIINNSLGYYNGDEIISDSMEYVYKIGLNDLPQSVFESTELVGYTENNLINGYGLDIYNSEKAMLTNIADGIMWLSETFHNEEIIFDLESHYDLGKIVLWNYNEQVLKGIKDFELYYSNDKETYTLINSYTLNQASGSNHEPYTSKINLTGINARYLKLKIISSHQNDANQVGLGKVMIFNEDDEYLFAKVKASSTDNSLVGNEVSARLWLQDGVVMDNYFYVFPIIVKDEANFFKVFDVSMIKVPIVNEKLDIDQAIYFDTPLQSQCADGGIIYYGAGVLNMSDSGGYENADGYIYVYGYKDLDEERSLIVARTLPENISNFNQWQYYDGTTWSNKINDSYGLITGVSAELSVTYLSEGMFAGKYMLVVMEDTLSGKVSYSLSDTPYGPFTDYQLLYKTPETYTLTNAYTYNAKMHPHLSEPGNYLISYNVNATKVSALQDVDIYRPRFIRCIEVKHK